MTAYPFNYRFTVRYVFEEVSFKVYLRLDNLGDESILWSAGHHFYFTLPWHDGLRRGDYRFEIAAKKCFIPEPDGSLRPVEKGWDKDTSFGNPANSPEYGKGLHAVSADESATFRGGSGAVVMRDE